MPDAQLISHLIMVLLVVTGMTVTAAAVTTGADATQVSNVAFGTTASPAENNSSVNITVGQQLSTIISASSGDVQTSFENTAFEIAYEREGEEGKAGAIADRAEDLRERAADIREDHQEATEEYEAGEISKSQYAQRLATLNARATNLLASYEQLNQRAQNVSELELRAAGANLSSLDASLENLSSITGPGSSALLAQYLGEAEGEIKLETTGGLKIEIESEDGESSREFKRPRDGDMSITVSHADAFQTARAALSTPEAGHWVLMESKVKPLEGAYEFEFGLADSAGLTGEAEVRVDGSTGEIYRLEQETERRGDDDREAEDGHDELTLLVVEGAPEPGATVTLQALVDGEPAEGVVIAVNDHEAGTTDANGTIVVTLPDGAEAEITAEAGEAEGELEFEFDDEHETDRVYQKLNVAASLGGDSVTVEVRFDGDPVRNATVYANDERIGKTGDDGTVTFAFDAGATEDLELEVVKGQFEAELAYVVQDGTLVLTEEEHEGDGDRAEHEEGGDDDERDEREDDGERENEADDGDRSLALAVVHGEAAPGATVTLEISADGEPVEGATVTVDGDVVGTTDANGTIQVTLPMEDSIELRAEHGDADGRLEFEFDEYEETETETEED